jgi:hypothetical protein
LVLLLVLLCHTSCYHLLPQHSVLLLKLHVYLRLAFRPSAQFANSLTRTFFKRHGPLLPFFKSRNGISHTSLCRGVLNTRITRRFFLQFAHSKKPRKNTTNNLLTRTQFQCFVNKAPRSSFKKLVFSTPLLLQGLRMMSLSKSVPEGLKPQECKCTKLHEPPPVPYVPDKDEVQEEVAKLRYLKIKPPQLSGVAQERDPRSIPHACDGDI